MGISLAALAANEATLEVPVASGEKVTLSYRPGAITGEFLSKSGRIVDVLPEVLVGWDLEEDGNPYPTDSEALARLPNGFVTAVFRAILEDQSPGKASSNGSESS